MRNGLIRLSRAALCVAACFGAASTAAAPTLPKVVAGQASFSQNGNVFSITNTPGTIINWQSFSVNAGEITRFIQQSSDSAVLNRIVGQDPSRILGALQSNGKVFLINPNGVVFGRDSRVDVGGLVASTLNMSDADFLAGKKNFTAGPHAGSIRNEGAITTPGGGKVFLVAPNVENAGIITAPNGEVVLAAGRSVQLVDAGNPDLTVVVSAPTDQAINLGQVVANGGRIGIYGALVNQRGVVNANSAVVGQDGRIVLKASKDTVLEQGSVTSATGAGKGGDIQLLGERVGLAGNAQVDASGALGGGTVLVGGDYQGKNAALPNAQQTWFGQDARIRADATGSGDGGKVVLWSDGATAAWGSISARGAGAGQGGLIETSGKELDVQGIRVDAGGRKTGTWLLDPWNIVVAADGTAKASDVNVFSKLPGSDTTRISAKTLTDTNADIVLQARNDLSILENIVTPYSLRAEAVHDLVVGAAVTSTGGDIDLRAGNQLTLNTGSALYGANYIDLKAERMALAGTIDGVNGVMPVLSFSTFRNGRDIFVSVGQNDNALMLDPGRLGAFGAYEINIGNSGHTGRVAIDNALSLSGNLLIDTSGSIDVNARVLLTGATSQFLATQHTPGRDFKVGGGGSIDATRRIGVAGAGRIAIGGALNAGEIDLDAGSNGIALTANLTANSRATLRTDGDIGQGNAIVKAPALLVEANSVSMSGNNEVGTLAGAATGGSFQFGWSGDLRIGSVGERAGLASQNRVVLAGGGLSVAEAVDAPVAIEVKAASIKGEGTLRSNELSLQSGGGIGEATRPLRTSTNLLLQAINTGSGSAPINIVNDRALSVGNVAQEAATGALNGGAVSIESTGGLTVASGVETSSGDISLITHSPLTINGTVSTGSGNVTLLADNKGLLTIGAGGQVKSASGSVRITAGDTVIPANGIDVAPGKLSVTKTNAPQDPGLPPPLDTCLANPNTQGCGNVIEQATRACIVNPEAEQCGRVLPPPQSCRENPDKLGCGVALVRECIATPTAPGCGEVLPPLATCRADAGVYGCVPVLDRAEFLACVASPASAGCAARLPSLAVCKATPGIEGCAQVLKLSFDACLINQNDPACNGILPTLSQCISNKAMAGCEVVLPTLQQCIVSPALQGCAVQLPSLAQCVANKVTAGCDAVLPTLQQCIVSPALQGCAVQLPSLAQCVANKATAGCDAVLPTPQQCAVSPTLQGCSVQPPTLAQCVANKTTAGCDAVLPTLQQCVASPTLLGCSVQLPTLAQCVANKATAGCDAVLPTAQQCVVSPTLQGCSVQPPTLAQCVANKATAGCDAVLPTLQQCIVSPALQGCSVQLPSLAQCVANMATAGCDAVLPTLQQCIVSPTLQGCAVQLPTLALCVANKATAGCDAVLPTLQQCIGNPTLQGCAVRLPTLAQCVAIPNQAGCEAVLPQPSYCSTHPTDPKCAVFNPAPAQGGGESKQPVAAVQQTTVTLINSRTPAQEKLPPAPATAGTQDGGEGAPAEQSEKQAEKQAGPAAATNTGVKNEKPAAKMYCN